MHKFFTISFIALIGLLSGCAVNKATIQQVEQVIEIKKDSTISCPPEDENRCAMQTPFAAQFVLAEQEDKNRVLLLDHGEESLMLRLHMIRAAQKTIEIQSFIWVYDEAGHLVIRELLAAAKRGVKVKVIIEFCIELFRKVFW